MIRLSYDNIKNFLVFSPHCVQSSIISIFFKEAIYAAVKTTKAGSLHFPLHGTGERYGQSVSINHLSSGIIGITSCSSLFPGYVTGPATEIFQPLLKILSRKDTASPLKQCQSTG